MHQFIESASSWVRGHLSTTDFEDQWGHSRSGHAAIGLYPRLVANQKIEALNNFYAPLVQILAQHQGGVQIRAWSVLRDAYLMQVTNSPAHPSEFAKNFSDWVCRHMETDAALQPWISEVAHFLVSRYEVSQGVEHALTGPMRVLGFSFDVDLSLREMRLPCEEPCTLAIFLHRTLPKVCTQRLSPADVLVVTEKLGRLTAEKRRMLGLGDTDAQAIAGRLEHILRCLPLGERNAEAQTSS